MEDLVAEFAKFEEHRNVDSCVVIILSHGNVGGRIMGVDGGNIRDNDIRDKFLASNCPNLANKPKIFLFVACRGRMLRFWFSVLFWAFCWMNTACLFFFQRKWTRATFSV